MRNESWLIGLVLAFLATQALAGDYASATIYYFDWDVSVRSRLKVDDVRKRFFTKVEISRRHDAVRFARSLPSTTKQSLPSPAPDVRLVIDLRTADGSVTTFFASQFRLYSHGGAESVEIDDAFKNRFRLLANACVPGK